MSNFEDAKENNRDRCNLAQCLRDNIEYALSNYADPHADDWSEDGEAWESVAGDVAAFIAKSTESHL